MRDGGQGWARKHSWSAPSPAVPTATVTNVLPSLGPAEGESAAGASGGVYVNHRPSARTWSGLGLGIVIGLGLANPNPHPSPNPSPSPDPNPNPDPDPHLTPTLTLTLTQTLTPSPPLHRVPLATPATDPGPTLTLNQRYI